MSDNENKEDQSAISQLFGKLVSNREDKEEIEMARKKAKAKAKNKSKAKTKAIYKFQPFVWTKETPMSPAGKWIPKPRSGHRMIFADGCFYSFGGYNPNIEITDLDLQDDPFWKSQRPLFKELWQFNVYSKRWRKLDMGESVIIPDQLASHSIVMVNGKFILFGGTGAPFGLTTSNDVFTMDLAMRSWTVMDTLPEDEEMEIDPDEAMEPHDQPQQQLNYPPAVYGQSVVLHKSHLYSIGGTSGFSYFMDVHRLDLYTKKWKCVYKSSNRPEEPKARYRHEMAIHGDLISVLGGGTSYESFDFEVIHQFNVITSQWSTIRAQPDTSVPIRRSLSEQYPAPRRCHSSVQMGTDVFIYGGYNGDQIFNDYWQLDLTSMAWKKLPSKMPEPVYFHASTVSNHGKIYSFGGVTSIEHNSRSRNVYSSWPKIPSLRAMCWEALNFYVPDLEAKKLQVMQQEGIPLDLIANLHCEGVPNKAG